MTHKERFKAIFHNERPDRLPVLFFGTWAETLPRWRSEGLDQHAGLQIPGMDPDWERGLWDCHGLVRPDPIGDCEYKVLEETADTVTAQWSCGEIVQSAKHGASIPHTIKHALEPTAESWERFKTFLDPKDPRRYKPGWEEKTKAIAEEDRVLPFMGGSLYGWLRGWMGVENISYIMYDDPELFDEMVEYVCNYFMTVYEPIIKKLKFDFVYFFEDCCGSSGPLFSPDAHKRFFDKRYRKMLEFYKSSGVELSLLDSDGKVEPLIQGWLDSGFDILFPIEVGKWEASPAKLRAKFGSRIKMFGGVDKHVIRKGERALREHLTALRPTVLEGGFLPIPDHRIPPDVSYEEFLTYIRVYKEVFQF
jgi:uroporphyrinogen decarboxylase